MIYQPSADIIHLVDINRSPVAQDHKNLVWASENVQTFFDKI
jgi:hypothetical protein